MTVAQRAGHKGGVSACAAFDELSTAQGVALVKRASDMSQAGYVARAT